MSGYTKSSYRKYIQSQKWQERRIEYLTDRYSCSACGLPRWLSPVFYDQDLHVDHLNYERVGSEEDWDLQALCKRCHEIKHFGRTKLSNPIDKYRVPNCPKCGELIWGRRCVNCLYNVISSLYGEIGDLKQSRKT